MVSLDNVYVILKRDKHCNNAYYKSLDKARDAVVHHCSHWFGDVSEFTIKQYKFTEVDKGVSYSIV